MSMSCPSRPVPGTSAWIPENNKSFSFYLGYSALPFCQWAGVLSLGIGDTFSAIIGSKFGRFKWTDTKKTMEGTAAAVLSQIGFLCLIYRFVAGGEVTWVAASAWFLLIALNSLLETFTHQVDNLVLSLLLFPALMNINWLQLFIKELMRS